MSDLQALILLLVTTALTAGVLVVGIREALGPSPGDGRAARGVAPSWRRIARATWPAAWGAPPQPLGEPRQGTPPPGAATESPPGPTHDHAPQPEGGVSR